MLFEVLIGLFAIVAGAVAAVTGFGIGSILTPVVSVKLGAQLAFIRAVLGHG
jgi:hypothetical protein